MVICLLDFVIMPVWYEISNYSIRHTDLLSTMTAISQLKDGMTQVTALQVLENQRSWKPITTEGTGIIHLSFLSILTMGGYGKIKEKVSSLQQQAGIPLPSGQTMGSDGMPDPPPPRQV